MTTNEPSQALEHKHKYLNELLIGQTARLHLLREELSLHKEDKVKQHSEIENVKAKIKANKESATVDIQEHTKLSTKLAKKLYEMDTICASIETLEEGIKKWEENLRSTEEELEHVTKLLKERGRVYEFQAKQG